jgi:hypothetical protein
LKMEENEEQSGKDGLTQTKLKAKAVKNYSI